MLRARILIGDENHTMLERLNLLLNQEFDIVEAVDNGPALIHRAVELTPDVIVADVCIPGCSGFEAITEIYKRVPGTKLVFVSMIQSAGLCEDLLCAGACGYVMKESACTDLIAAVREALTGGRYASPRAEDGVYKAKALPTRSSGSQIQWPELASRY